jgi:hypothetical protein
VSGAPTPIDVWDIGTFDDDLLAELRVQASMIKSYFTTDHQIFLDYDLGRSRDPGSLRPSNPWARGFYAFKEHFISRTMAKRTIRAWHYTRLTDPEVAAMRRDGIHLSTPATLRARLDMLVGSGELDREVADAAYEASRFHGAELESRCGKFWMTSHPIAVEESLVDRLLAYWGGEVASFGTDDPRILAALSALGRPRVLELAVPLSAAGKFDYRAADAVVATFGRSLGCIPENHVFDLYVIEPLPSAALLAVHTEGDSRFGRIGRDFPSGFVDVDIGRWRELTGEEDD